MYFFTTLAGLGLFIASATAHMQLYYPAPFNASNNPHRTTETADPYLEFPYDKAGENARWVYPCMYCEPSPREITTDSIE